MCSRLGGELFGQPIYKKASDIPDTDEGAVIAICAKFTVDALKQCLERGAKWVTIVPGGFRETGTKEGINAEVGALVGCNGRKRFAVWRRSITAVSLDPTVWVSMILATWILCSLEAVASRSLRSVMWVFSPRVELWERPF